MVKVVLDSRDDQRVDNSPAWGDWLPNNTREHLSFSTSSYLRTDWWVGGSPQVYELAKGNAYWFWWLSNGCLLIYIAILLYVHAKNLLLSLVVWILMSQFILVPGFLYLVGMGLNFVVNMIYAFCIIYITLIALFIWSWTVQGLIICTVGQPLCSFTFKNIFVFYILYQMVDSS